MIRQRTNCRLYIRTVSIYIFYFFFKTLIFFEFYRCQLVWMGDVSVWWIQLGWTQLEWIEWFGWHLFLGRVYEVGVTYPRHLHDGHNDLSFLPKNCISRGSKMRKQMVTFEKETNYVVHYRNLQQAIKNGLIVEKLNIYIL